MMTAKKILILENHPDNGQFLTEYLSLAGHSVELVQTVEGALAACARNWPEVIIAETRVTNGNGENLLELLKKPAGNLATPIICISADTLQRHIDRAFALGAYAFLAKPCSNAQIGAVIANLPTAAASPARAFAASA
jgi:DNA-binding NtrC family response regulator